MSSLHIDRLLETVIKKSASDLHLTVGRPPVIRLHGQMRSLETKVLGPEDTTALMKSITPDRNQALFRLSNIEIVTQLIEGKFPDYNQIIPTSHSTRAVISTHDLMRAVRISVLFSRDVANIVRLDN